MTENPENEDTRSVPGAPGEAARDGSTERDVREGWVSDPNLGDVPLDQQPHPGSDDEPAEAEE
ncbi:MAG: hypothetical protein JO147_10595 [Actinobacteria bacterium]|nr:hypothetical protein [Actinomycetota bacterium]